MDSFLYNSDLRHERVNDIKFPYLWQETEPTFNTQVSDVQQKVIHTWKNLHLKVCMTF